MQCPEFESRLDAILDQRRDPRADALLAAHAAFCEPCSDLLADQVTVLNTLNRLQRADLVVSRRMPPARLPASRSLPLVASVAAAMLLALGLVWQLRGRQDRVGEVARQG